MKNCYPSPGHWASSEQNASADTLSSRPTRSVLIVVNILGAKRFDTLSQPLL